METQEVLDNLVIAQAQIEWEYSMNIAAALDVAKKRIEDWGLLKLKIADAKVTASRSLNVDYKNGYLSALSYIEGLMAEMENEDDSN